MNIYTNSGNIAEMRLPNRQDIRLEVQRDATTRSTLLYVVGRDLSVTPVEETNVVGIRMFEDGTWKVLHQPDPREGEEVLP